jgi:hypothetical protein
MLCIGYKPKEVKMTLQQLNFVVEIVKTALCSEAANACIISQPSLSNALKDLVKELGFELFIRNNRGKTLSVNGSEFWGMPAGIEQTECWKTGILALNPRCHLFVSHSSILLRSTLS